MPGRRVRTTAQRLWVDLGICPVRPLHTSQGVTPLTPIMGRATDPGENHDPGKDQRFTPNLTQAPRLENSLGRLDSFTRRHPNGWFRGETRCQKRPVRTAGSGGLRAYAICVVVSTLAPITDVRT